MKNELKKLLAPVIREVIDEREAEFVKVVSKGIAQGKRKIGRWWAEKESYPDQYRRLVEFNAHQKLLKCHHTSDSTEVLNEIALGLDQQEIVLVLPTLLNGYCVELSLSLKPQQPHSYDNTQAQLSPKVHRVQITPEEMALYDYGSRSTIQIRRTVH